MVFAEFPRYTKSDTGIWNEPFYNTPISDRPVLCFLLTQHITVVTDGDVGVCVSLEHLLPP